MPDETPGKPPRQAPRRGLTPRTGPGVGAVVRPRLAAAARARPGLLLFHAVGQTLSYSEFKQAVREGRVQEVTVADDRVRGDAEGGHAGQAALHRDPHRGSQALEDLEKHGVKYTGEVASRWVGEVLGWVIPLIFLVALWSFFFRRMGGAEGGVMSFARSRRRFTPTTT